MHPHDNRRYASAPERLISVAELVAPSKPTLDLMTTTTTTTTSMPAPLRYSHLPSPDWHDRHRQPLHGGPDKSTPSLSSDVLTHALDQLPPVPDIKRYAKLLTPFIYKLYCLVSDAATNTLCEWSPHGNSFIVHDPVTFSCKVLPTYFKHNQFSSFVRQLNKYSFHKLAPSAFIFGHTHFLRQRPELLLQIGPPRPQERAVDKRAIGGAPLSSLKSDDSSAPYSPFVQEDAPRLHRLSLDRRLPDVDAIEQLVRSAVLRETQMLHRELRIADDERNVLLQRLCDAERRLELLENVHAHRFGEKRLRTER